MSKNSAGIPDSTAVRVALWRAMHFRHDSPPHVLVDEIGIKLVNPDAGWENRPDMHPMGTRPFRASIVARARFIEDIVCHEVETNSLNQYVILGAGLDTFSLRRSDIAQKLNIFEVEKKETLSWKEKRINEIGLTFPKNLNFVPFDFEEKSNLWAELKLRNFDLSKPTIITSIGVSMYLTLDAIKATLNSMKKLSTGSKFIMTFMLPLELVNAEDRAGYEMSINGAKRSGTPFISFFSPDEMMKLFREMGFSNLEHRTSSSFTEMYFGQRSDGLKPSSGEEFMIVTL